MKTYNDFIKDCLQDVEELFPWDLAEILEHGEKPFLLDVREPYEFEKFHITGSINVPRGVLEPACEYGYEDTCPLLAGARDKDVIVICRSGQRSVLAAYIMQLMGYKAVKSLKTGIRGWNDFEQPMQDGLGNIVDIDEVDEFLNTPIPPELLEPTA